MLREQWTALYQLATSVVENFLADAATVGFLRPDLDAKSTAVSIIAVPFGTIACDPGAPADRIQAEKLVRATVAMVTSGVRNHQDATADNA